MVADRDDGNIKAKRSILLLCGYYMEDYEVMVLFQALPAYKVSIDAFCPEKRAGDVCQTSVHECSAHQGVQPEQIIFTDVAMEHEYIRHSALADLFLDS
ncbi:hypothetical protein ACOSQ2_019352 [Xanthoceras sorbifolium]